MKGPDAEQWHRRHNGSRARTVLAFMLTLAVALGALALVAFREDVGFDELARRAARMWFTFWEWLGLGTGTRLGQGLAFGN